MVDRRTILGFLAASNSLADTAPAPVGLATGNYGMKALSLTEAIRTVSAIGFDGIEFALPDGWPSSPQALSPADRREIRALLERSRLSIPSMMESLNTALTPERRAFNLERLKHASQLAHDLSPARPPLLQTVLGLKPADWEPRKQTIVDELRDWAALAEKMQMTFCFKPHAGNAIHSPEQAIWVVQQVASPRIRLNYDYSHMAVEGRPLESSLRQMLPHAAYIQVKDAKGTPEQYEYLLPGDGTTDYVHYFRLLRQLGYKGWVTVEISSMIHRKPGYDPIATAKLCYQRMSDAFRKAGLPRPTNNQNTR